jgi:hypothetical protein
MAFGIGGSNHLNRPAFTGRVRPLNDRAHFRVSLDPSAPTQAVSDR